ncbi:DNA-directed RNA polymerase subunit beta [Streptococcus entericus]|uniref:DNA-directed RNA polymerase subunit beta n=1 Tax=Streptococcus entericus TaxID=155680 RepID=UPI000365D1D6
METGWKYVVKRLGMMLFVALLCLLFLSLGLMIGYGVLGDGDNATAILSLEKWRELIGKFTGQ